MRVIPVIDLLEGQAVHAVRGERENYRPVQSVLCNTPDPMTLALAFRDRLGLNEIYIADLNAIQRSAGMGHRHLIAALAGTRKIKILLDAGISRVADARAWLSRGIHKAVIGAETLRHWTALQEIPAAIDGNRLIFSLDLRSGKILSRCREFAALPPLDAIECLESAGWREIIILELSRVGSGQGIDHALVAEARARFPQLKLLAGGGLFEPAQLPALESLGIDGLLVATALHQGIITAQHLSALGGTREQGRSTPPGGGAFT